MRRRTDHIIEALTPALIMLIIIVLLFYLKAQID